MHSTTVGGSTAARVMACPGSSALCETVPRLPSSRFADKGTLLHDAIARMVTGDTNVLGLTYKEEVITQNLIDDKLTPALALFNAVGCTDYELEVKVEFGAYIPNAFGTADIIGRLGDRAVVLDWKFGDGVMVDAKENAQLMFYAAAAMRKREYANVDEIELIIIQPPNIRRWVTTRERLQAFEVELRNAVMSNEKSLNAGKHCRWCAARPVCPAVTGAVDRALQSKLQLLDAVTIGAYLKDADVLQGWIDDLKELAITMMSNDAPVPGWKLVDKRANRRWVDETATKEFLTDTGNLGKFMELVSPAKVEKILGKKSLPEGLVEAVSSGVTLAPVDDPRRESVNMSRLSAALNRVN